MGRKRGKRSAAISYSSTMGVHWQYEGVYDRRVKPADQVSEKEMAEMEEATGTIIGISCPSIFLI